MLKPALVFDAGNPFPLLDEDSHSYAEAQRHSAEVDAYLGIKTEPIEQKLLGRETGPNQNLWIGLPSKALLTPYTELRRILSELNPQPGETVVDLGAAYGRMGFVIARHYPGVKFIGYEMVSERVIESQRCLREAGISPEQIRMEEADLSRPDFKLAAAEFYFLYDYGSRAAIEKTLEDLRLIASNQKICVVGRGRAVRDAIELRTPWLSQVKEPQHFRHYSIYRS